MKLNSRSFLWLLRFTCEALKVFNNFIKLICRLAMEANLHESFKKYVFLYPHVTSMFIFRLYTATKMSKSNAQLYTLLTLCYFCIEVALPTLT